MAAAMEEVMGFWPALGIVTGLLILLVLVIWGGKSGR